MTPAALSACPVESTMTAPDVYDITFADGLLGFPDCRGFQLAPTARPGVFWLQSTEFEPLAFVLVDPFVYFDTYSVELSDVDVARLQPARPADIVILATVTLSGAGTTANLQGPLAINIASGQARQVIASDSSFGVRVPVALDVQSL